MVLSTLAELEDDITKNEEKTEETVELKKEVAKKVAKEVIEEVAKEVIEEESKCVGLDNERQFCESMRERILVLFEGFQSPNNKSIEAKVDLTLNFLEYSLAVLDERLEKLDNR